MIYYSSFGDLNKFKVSLLYEEATEIESIDCARIASMLSQISK